uniref:Uncharacterized protein n=1 Tax=Glossina palpalis gambiensis TaxID=67801 RepID=A0A1B0BFX4_9MUSC
MYHSCLPFMVTKRTQTRIHKYERSNIARGAHFINLATLCSERTLTAIQIQYKLVVCRSRSVLVISKLAVHKSLSNWSRLVNRNDSNDKLVSAVWSTFLATCRPQRSGRLRCRHLECFNPLFNEILFIYSFYYKEDSRNEKVYNCLTLGKSNTCPVKDNNVSRLS